MPKSPQKTPQTVPEMIEAQTIAKREKSRIYKVESAEFQKTELAALINKTAAELVDAVKNEKICISNTEAIQRQTVLYLKSCEESGTFPSMNGLARALGYSRRALYWEIDHRSTPATADWLEVCRDAFSDVLTESALKNNCNSIVSIFINKAVYGLRESVELIATPNTSAFEDSTPQSLIEAAKMLPDASRNKQQGSG